GPARGWSAMKLAGALAGCPPGLWPALEMHIERHRRADKCPQGRLVDLLVFVDVDRASDISLEARVEQASGVLQCGSFGKCHLDGVLVRLSRADDACVRPDGSSPLPLFHHLSVRLAYDRSYFRECFPAPIPKFPDSLVDQSRCRFHRDSRFHLRLQRRSSILGQAAKRVKPIVSNQVVVRPGPSIQILAP